MTIRAAMIPLLVASLVLAASLATAAEEPRAKALFQEGLAAMMAGDLEGGCPKIESAYQISGGAGALFTAAECYAKWGKPTTALLYYRDYLKVYARLEANVRSRQAERAKLAATQVAALNALAPSLRVVVTGDDRAGVEVTVDGVRVRDDALDAPLLLEVGSHRVEVKTAAGRTTSRTFELVEGAQRRWEVKLGGDPEPDPPPPEPEPESWSSLQAAGVVIAGTGVALVVVGSITGGLAIAERGTVDDRCVDLVCDQEGLDAADSGRTLGDVSTATLAIGGAALITGIVLLAVGAGDDGDSSAGLGLRPDGLQWRF